VPLWESSQRRIFADVSLSATVFMVLLSGDQSDCYVALDDVYRASSDHSSEESS
jgi:hypothetical protein